MTTRVRKYTAETCGAMGEAIYDRHIKPALRPEDLGKFVAIDVDSGNYVIDSDDWTASHRLVEQHPNAQVYIMKAGHRAAYQMGGFM